MTSTIRPWAAGLLIAAVSLGSSAAWAAVETSPGQQAGQPAAPDVAQGNGQPPEIPEMAAPQAGGAPGAPGQSDANADGISDALAAQLEAAAPGEQLDVIVVFEIPNGVARARAAVGQFPVTREFSIINGVQASMTAAQIRALSSVPGVFRIQENSEVRAFDAYLNDDTGVTDAWTFTDSQDHPIDGTGVTICVIDTGINAEHEQFNDGTNNKVLGFADFVNGQTEPYDDQGHGTHVSGIAAGDGVGTHWAAGDAIGVAPGASLKVAKVLDANGFGSEANLLSGIEWCADEANLMSLSLGGEPSDGNDSLSLAVNCAADPAYDPAKCGDIDANIVVVAAGNSGAKPGTIGTPGVAKNAITVGSFAEWSGDPAANWQDDGVYLNPFSSRGPVANSDKTIKPDITGVGSNVASAYISNPDSYAVASGTSMATPHISGVIALMLQANPDLGVVLPDGVLPHQKVRDILAQTAVDRGPLDENGNPVKDNEYGWGLVDAYAAVAEALSAMSYSGTDYPGYTLFSGTVPEGTDDSESQIYEFTVGPEHIGLPIAAMMTIDGNVACHEIWGCLVQWWDPDLELIAEYHDGTSWEQVPRERLSNGNLVEDLSEVTLSTCPAGDECGTFGRVEVVHFVPDFEGAYRFRAYPYAGDPNNGKGGDFTLEISMGAPESGGDTNSPPTASFTFSCTELTCDFDGSDSAGSIASYAWDFGDESTDFGATVSHTYSDYGSYTVTLTVTDDDGATDSVSKQVSLSDPAGANNPPTVSIDSPTNGSSFTARKFVTFTGSASDDEDGDLTGSLAWASDLDGSLGTGDSFSISTLSVGSHQITASVTDSGGLEAEALVNVTIDPIVAHIGELSGESVSAARNRWEAHVTVLVLDADNAAVGDATVDGTWSDGANGGGFCPTGADGKCTVIKSNLKNNVSSVTFTVTGITGEGMTWDGVGDSITVVRSETSPDNESPTASFTYTCTELACDFDGSGSSDSDGSITSYAWSFGDGSTGSGVTVSHTYAAGGTNTVTLTVTDDDGATGETDQTIEVSEAGSDAISLSANGYKVKGVHTVDLTWSGATSTDVDIHRNGDVVATTANDGADTDSTGNKGGGSYTYKVCEAPNTSTCSDEVTVAF